MQLQTTICLLVIFFKLFFVRYFRIFNSGGSALQLPPKRKKLDYKKVVILLCSHWAIFCAQVAWLLDYGECAASDACVDGIKCFATGFTYSVFENVQCTGQAIGNAAVFTCPPTSPSCYGARVGVTPATSTVPGTGPCLPTPPPCTAAGNFSINNANGTRGTNFFNLPLI